MRYLFQILSIYIFSDTTNELDLIQLEYNTFVPFIEAAHVILHIYYEYAPMAAGDRH